MDGPTRAPAKNPCGSCPYRTDVPSGIWHRSEYDKLAEYDRPFIEQPMGAFHCHQQDGRLCAGWVGCHDMENTLAFRINARSFTKEVIQAVLNYETSVPLFESGAAAREHGLQEYANPGTRANKIMDKMLRTGKVTQG